MERNGRVFRRAPHSRRLDPRIGLDRNASPPDNGLLRMHGEAARPVIARGGSLEITQHGG